MRNSLYCSPHIVRVIKSRRLRWAGHVSRMEEDRSSLNILTGTTTGNYKGSIQTKKWKVSTQTQRWKWTCTNKNTKTHLHSRNDDKAKTWQGIYTNTKMTKDLNKQKYEMYLHKRNDDKGPTQAKIWQGIYTETKMTKDLHKQNMTRNLDKHKVVKGPTQAKIWQGIYTNATITNDLPTQVKIWQGIYTNIKMTKDLHKHKDDKGATQTQRWQGSYKHVEAECCNWQVACVTAAPRSGKDRRHKVQVQNYFKKYFNVISHGSRPKTCVTGNKKKYRALQIKHRAAGA